tara:strand:- start:357 stop:578 length:222 start_codon:yes stop_codon:yes gene_type:complete
MKNRHAKSSTPKPFKAKLRHYHRSILPQLPASQQKASESLSDDDLEVPSTDQPSDDADLSANLAPPGSTKEPQ